MVQQRISRSSMDKGGKKNSWGIQIALELAELDDGAHGLRYESGISRGCFRPTGLGGSTARVTTPTTVYWSSTLNPAPSYWPHWLG